MAVFLQPTCCPLVDRHVEKELHPRLSGRGGREGLLAGEPRGVFDGFVDVLKFQVRVAPKNFFFRFSGSQQIEDQMDWNSHASDTGLAPQFVRLDRPRRTPGPKGQFTLEISCLPAGFVAGNIPGGWWV